MQRLHAIYLQHLKRTSLQFSRYLLDEIDWSSRLIGIMGSRGAGKTTMMLQHIKRDLPAEQKQTLYVSLDNLWFQTNRLYDLADQFQKDGGKYLFLDEVHKYPTWSQEIKNIYDDFPDMKLVFTGSSILEIYKSQGDLSRRVALYHLAELSFREFLALEYGVKLPSFSLQQIMSDHVVLSQQVLDVIRPLPAFKEYLRYGSFPYYKEGKALYGDKLLATLHTILEVDLPSIEKIDFSSIGKLKKLFAVISTLVPFTPNISKLSGMIEVSRATLMLYLGYLERAQAIQCLSIDSLSMKQVQKPEKVYLGNTNYAYALVGDAVDIGTLRETFFINQVRVKHKVASSSLVDFFVDQCYHVEVGGKSKTQKQLKSVEHGVLALDNIEIGYANEIPLWLFGFLY